MLSRRSLTTIGGSILALVLLYFAFKNVDGAGLKRELAQMDRWTLLAMASLSLAGLFCRGWRWWLLLARPVKPGEFWAIQRALAVSYAVGNFVSRFGEVVRIAIARSETRRPLGGLTGTVVLDRLLFDGLAFAMMLVSAVFLNREALVTLFPQAIPAIWSLAAVVIVGGLALFWVALQPSSVKRVLLALKLNRIPFLGPLLLGWVDQASSGLSVLAKPRFLLAANAVNVLVWFLPFLYFCLTLAIFDVEASLAEIWFVFSLTIVGVLIPSPGGLGSYHFMVTLGLTQLIGLDNERAAAVALVSHGLNYTLLFVAGIPAWWLSRMAVKRREDVSEIVR